MIVNISKHFKIRPLPKKGTSHVFKVIVSPENILLLGMKAGDACNLYTSSNYLGQAVIWYSQEKLADDVVKISSDLQELYDLKSRDKISIASTNDPWVRAANITLTQVDRSLNRQPSMYSSEIAGLDWALLVQLTLENQLRDQADGTGMFVTPGQILENVEVCGNKRSFKVQTVNSSAHCRLYRIEAGHKLCISLEQSHQSKHPSEQPDEHKYRALSVSSDGVGGLDLQMEKINDLLGFYCDPTDIIKDEVSSESLTSSGVSPFPRGIVLHGEPGTGKSLLLRKISEAGWNGVFKIGLEVLSRNVEQVKSSAAQIFSDALNAQPSVVIIDNFDASDHTAPQFAERGTEFTHFLCEQLDLLKETRVLVVAAVRNLSSINVDLLEPNRLSRRIRLPVPNTSSRAEILKALRGLPKKSTHPFLDRIAAETKWYVGRELNLLVNYADETCIIRRRKRRVQLGEGLDRSVEPDVETLTKDMEISFEEAQREVRPEGVGSIIIEPPKVKFSEIVGQENVKKKLEEVFAWPVKYPELSRQFSVKTSKGLLLYGPPGCSKTMVAQAAATESGFNFISVKGSELTQMYVGESERAVRNVFEKARSANPCIVFFDEIDAIAADTGMGQHSGVQTATTLLNEIDGIHKMENVFILAATNKPELLHPALLRAGRFDTNIYVGLPSIKARREILESCMLSLPVDKELKLESVLERTEGRSGAEMVEICNAASRIAMRETIETGAPAFIREEHLVSALAGVDFSVSKKMVEEYKAWGKSRH